MERDWLPDDDTNQTKTALVGALEKLSNLSPRDYAKIGGFASAAAVVGVAAYWLIKRGRNHFTLDDVGEISLSEGDRHSPELIAIVQRSGKDGNGQPTDIAISLPKAEDVVDGLFAKGKSKALFAMQPKNPINQSGEHISFAYPLNEDPDGRHTNKYSEGVQMVAGWITRIIKNEPTDDDSS